MKVLLLVFTNWLKLFIKNCKMNDIEIRKLNLNKLVILTEILDKNNSWKKLMEIIPARLDAGDSMDYKYSGEDFELIEQAKEQRKSSCTAILFEEWGTSGKVRPRLSTLRQLLIKAELFRAADYVSELLNVPPPERPKTGPAALVPIPNSEQLPVKSETLIPLSVSLFFQPTPPPSPNFSGESLSSFLPVLDNMDINIELRQSVQDSVLRNLLLDGNEAVDLPYKALVAITNDFNVKNCLGKGSCGTVYLGTVNPTGKMIAIKKLHKEKVPGGADKQFRNEITAISKIKHPNLLTLLGFSTDGDSLCLVYPFMGNGSLCDMLANEENRKKLIWNLRLEIARGVAKGIAHLHGLQPQPLIHRDIKTANVLLDDEMVPKLCDFGLVRAVPVDETQSTALTTTVIGTSAYMALEAFRGEISVKMDVFSFGVVLLELLTGQPAIDDDGPLVDTIFDKRVDSSTTSKFLMEDIVDSLAGDWGGDWNKGVPYHFLQVALNCVAADKNSRPHISAVVELLENIINKNIT